MHKAESTVLAGRMVELERNMKKDAVHRELDHRTERAELTDRGVLRSLSMDKMICR